MLSRGCSVNKLKISNWLYGPEWLLTKEYPDQTVERAAVNELVVEINPITTTTPLLDPSKFSKYTRVIRIVFKVLQFLRLKLDPFETLVKQEQLHCNSIYICLSNSNTPVTRYVKNTIRELNLHLVNKVIRNKGRLFNSDLPLDIQTWSFALAKTHFS